MSNLIPITRIYDIYPKYTYSNDVKKFMDEIVDIDRVNVFTKTDIVDTLDKIKTEIFIRDKNVKDVRTDEHCFFTANEIFEIIDKYIAESENKK